MPEDTGVAGRLPSRVGRVPAGRGLVALAAAMGLTCLTAGFAGAAPTAPPPVRAEAGLLVDLTSGKVLYAKNAETDRPPASLVKLMTLYLAHEDLRVGRVQPGDLVPISANAAQTPRFRLGLSVGQVVPLETLLAAVAVASANDAATAVAEHLAGTEAAFVSRMNDQALRLGLTHTVFANPHGLPDPEQRTTARDVSRLVEHLLQTFPESRGFLGETEFSWQGHAFQRRIPLFENPGGVTALKTGFTLQAGYNLAVTVGRAGQRLLCVILGADTRGQSFLEAARLLRYGFGESDSVAHPAPRRWRPRPPKTAPR